MILLSSIHNPPLTPPPPSPKHHYVTRAYRLRRFISFDSAINSPAYPGLYALPVPNLELHSAAASGNVGLVHYALTHGQPVNSVLHGVLPLHAACSGGSVSVVRMLLENGADVNAPRLPRRYSDGKKGTAPSVGTAGSTPLHFAAANGHAPIVQMLLACGADPTKRDKNGNTAEDLAALNGHEDVVKVLHVYHRLQEQDAMSQSERAEPPSPSGSSVRLPEGEHVESIKGKERARSEGSMRMKKSLEGLLRRGTRYSSGSEASHLGSSDQLPSPVDTEPEDVPLERVASAQSSNTGTSILINSPPNPPPRGRLNSTSSHRPTLPSILEKAVHPGQAFRAALRHHGEKEAKVQFSPDASAESVGHESHHPGGFFKGRRKSQDDGHKKHAKHGLKGLFRRSHSPPSRSPSPPLRTESKVVDPEELEEGIQRLKRASLDLEGEAEEAREAQAKPVATSAPATKTQFFPDSPRADRPMNRPRTGSEVIAPSPLANEWAHDTDDSDTPVPKQGIRRVRTEVIRIDSPLDDEPSSPRSYRPRSATHTGSPVGLGWEDDVDLRKVAASGLIRRESQRRQSGHEGEADASPSGDQDATPTPHSEQVMPEGEQEQHERHARGLSTGSTTESSHLSTPPGSAFRMSAMSEMLDDARQGKNGHGLGRARGPSVSSTSSGTSGMGLSFAPSASTPSTSLTPPSALSLLPAGSLSGFPPVPEHEVAPAFPPHRRTVTQRTVSSHAEAKEVVKRNEDDILHLAQLPPSLDSSRSLAEQLAAYGENVAMEEKFAALERRQLTPRESEDGESFVTAESEWSRGSSRSSGRKGIKGRAVSSPLPPLTFDTRPSAVNSIYDKRADAYRKHMAALSAVQPVLPSSTRHAQHRARQRAASASASASASAGVWLGEEEEAYTISNPVTGQRPKAAAAPGGGSRPHARPTSKFTLPLSDATPTLISTGTTPGPGSTPTSTSTAPGSLGVSPYVSIFSHRYAATPLNEDESDDEEQERREYTVIENDWRGGHVVRPGELPVVEGKKKWGLKRLGRR